MQVLQRSDRVVGGGGRSRHSYDGAGTKKRLAELIQEYGQDDGADEADEKAESDKSQESTDID